MTRRSLSIIPTVTTTFSRLVVTRVAAKQDGFGAFNAAGFVEGKTYNVLATSLKVHSDGATIPVFLLADDLDIIREVACEMFRVVEVA